MNLRFELVWTWSGGITIKIQQILLKSTCEWANYPLRGLLSADLPKSPWRRQSSPTREVSAGLLKVCLSPLLRVCSSVTTSCSCVPATSAVTTWEDDMKEARNQAVPPYGREDSSVSRRRRSRLRWLILTSPDLRGTRRWLGTGRICIICFNHMYAVERCTVEL